MKTITYLCQVVNEAHIIFVMSSKSQKHRQKLGKQGEMIAVQHLIEHGYHIVAQNWRCFSGELDIIAKQKTTLVFVEVRTRRGHRFGAAEASITPAKQAKLVELAYTYLQEHALDQHSWRIDVIAVQLESEGVTINHIENAVGW